MKVADKRILYLIIDALFNQQQEKKYLIELDCIKDFLSLDEQKILYTKDYSTTDWDKISEYRRKIVDILDTLRLNFGCEVSLNIKTDFIEATTQEIGMGFLAAEAYQSIIEDCQRLSDTDSILNVFIKYRSSLFAKDTDQNDMPDTLIKTADKLFLQRTSVNIYLSEPKILEQKLTSYAEAYENNSLDRIVHYDEKEHFSVINKILKLAFKNSEGFPFSILNLNKSIEKPEDYNLPVFLWLSKKRLKLDIRNIDCEMSTSPFRITKFDVTVGKVKRKNLKITDKKTDFYNDDFIHFEMYSDDKIKQIVYENQIIQLTYNQLFVIHTLCNKSKNDDVMQKIKNVYKTHGSLRKMKSDINKAFLRAGVYDFLESSGQKDNYRLDITTAYKIEKHK